MSFAPFPEWQWEIPEFFNIGVACTDAHLGTPVEDRVAMIVEDDTLGASSITYRELAKRTRTRSPAFTSRLARSCAKRLVRFASSR